MKKIHLVYLITFLLTSTRCKESPPVFATYAVDPLKESIINNKVTTCLAYGYVNGKLENVDSVSYDQHGNTTSRISKGHWMGDLHFWYDSLGRVTRKIENGDTFTENLIQYESFPENQTVIISEYARVGKTNSRLTLVSREFLTYNKDLTKILSRTVEQVYAKYSETRSTTKHEYEGDRIKKMIEERKGKIESIAEYFYDKEQLTQIQKNYDHDTYQIDYVSKKTGLLDSTIVKNEDVKLFVSYKYY